MTGCIMSRCQVSYLVLALPPWQRVTLPNQSMLILLCRSSCFCTQGQTMYKIEWKITLMERFKQQSPNAIPNAKIVLRDQLNVTDSTLYRELKQLVCHQPVFALLKVHGEAIRWEREGKPRAVRGWSQSVPMEYGIQYGVHSQSELSELQEITAARDRSTHPECCMYAVSSAYYSAVGVKNQAFHS